MNVKSNPKNLEFYKYNYDVYFEKEEPTHPITKGNKEESADLGESVDKPSMPPLEDDEEEAKEWKRLKTVTPNKL